MNFNNILYEEAVGVATITINRPHRLNALNIDTVHEMIAALGRASADAGVRVVVITGAGDAFCAGADLKDAPDPLTPAGARVTGRARGGGCCPALASDIRIASERASFGLAFVNIGISGADMGATYFLPRLVGYGRACEMLMTGEPIDAHEAERIGLGNRVGPHDALATSTDAMVRRGGG